ncbi:Calx-beta domain-containing protein [Actinophytocola glycyrrhizae]|uniref:Calx-beta domain-containing protein n=1 Tax=Actinophytocola glycyrrhizae TaxID=2044873 RepID=A0ABV9S975_9PSEU
MRARVLALAAAAVLGQVVAGGGTATAEVCAPPTVTIADAHPMYEGSDGGTNVATLTVTMAVSRAGCPAAGSVRYSTVGGTAEAGQDFVATTGTLGWTGPGPRVVQVQLVRDDLYEQDEQFSVTLFGPRGVTIADGSAVVPVLNDDASASRPGVVVAVPASGICWWPSDHCALPLGVNTVARAPVAVRLRTADGTAVAGKDYLPIKDRVVTVPAGADRVQVPVELLAGAEPGEYFRIEISGTNAGTIGTARMTVTIQAR